MDVKIISTDIIKPSSPTPLHLKTYNLSLLDQFNLDGRYPLIFFYSPPTQNTTKTTSLALDHLKNSLAQTLTHYYPFAGRVKDSFSIDCDDSGAPLVEAHVANNMSEIVKRLEFDELEQLMPFKGDPMKLYTDQNILVVQVNYFSCGGVAISAYFKHVIADGPAAVNFIKTWSAIASGGDGGSDSSVFKDVVFDCASVFPPQDLPLHVLWRRCFLVNVPLGEAVVKRFTFDGTKMDALRGKIGDRSTRFEAVTTLILVAAAGAARERADFKTTNVVLIPVNLRRRMNPCFPEQCMGNVGQATMVKWKTDEYNILGRKIGESIRKIDDKHAREVNEGGGFMNELKNINEEMSKMNLYFVSSLSRSGIYEADFGWGKPAWANVVLKYNNLVVISDTSDGDNGIEAWVGLPKQDMVIFEKNSDILAYASLN